MSQEHNTQWVVVRDGDVYGPFATNRQARAWAENEWGLDGVWSVTALVRP